MKKIILLIAVTLLTFANSFAQEEVKEDKGFKGVWWGLATASYTNSEADDKTSFTILPAIGTFISPTVTIGAAVGLTSTKIGNADATNITIIKPLLRKYYGMSDKFFLFAEVNSPILLNENFKAYGFNIEPGIDYFIGGKWTVEAKFGRFGYSVFSPNEGDSTATTTLGFNMYDSQTQEGLGSGLSLGLKYIF